MAGPKMTSGHVYYLKVLCKLPVSFIGIAKDGTFEENRPNATAYGWSHQQQCLCWSAGAATKMPQVMVVTLCLGQIWSLVIWRSLI